MVKILTYYFNFWGSQASFGFWCASWANAQGVDAYAQHAHQFLTRMLSTRISPWRVCSAWYEGPFKIRFFLRVCWAYASGTETYAQQAHQFLTRMLRVRISPWCACSACFEGNAILKIILSKRIRNLAAPNRPLNICFKFFYFNPKVALRSRLYGEKTRKIRVIEYLTLGHLFLKRKYETYWTVFVKYHKKYSLFVVLQEATLLNSAIEKTWNLIKNLHFPLHCTVNNTYKLFKKGEL